ncbi:MAG: ABC-2 transporter permease [Clostridioides sp.]|jgi:hypothetical protein|nr:ABC-2 transporter permease [Clostridioides sp.]
MKISLAENQNRDNFTKEFTEYISEDGRIKNIFTKEDTDYTCKNSLKKIFRRKQKGYSDQWSLKNTLYLARLSISLIGKIKKSNLICYVIMILLSCLNPWFSMVTMAQLNTILREIMAVEEKNDFDFMITKLPVTRKDYVISRYILIIGNILLSIAIVGITFIIFAKVGHNISLNFIVDFNNSTFSSSNTKDLLYTFYYVIILGLPITLLFQSFEIPMIMEKGVKKSRGDAIVAAFMIIFIIIVIFLTPIGLIIFVEDEFMKKIIVGMIIGLSILILALSYTFAEDNYIKKDIN